MQIANSELIRNLEWRRKKKINKRSTLLSKLSPKSIDKQTKITVICMVPFADWKWKTPQLISSIISRILLYWLHSDHCGFSSILTPNLQGYLKPPTLHVLRRFLDNWLSLSHFPFIFFLLKSGEKLKFKYEKLRQQKLLCLKFGQLEL